MRVTDLDKSGEREAGWMGHDGGELAESDEGAIQIGYDDTGLTDDRATGARTETMHGRVLKLIDNASWNLLANITKVSVADLVRLMQVERELRPQGCGRLVVEWIDPKPEAG